MRIAIDGRLLNKVQNTGISRYTEFLMEFYSHRYPEAKIFLIVNDPKIKFDGFDSIFFKSRPFSIMGFLFFYSFIKELNVDLLHSPFYSGLRHKIPTTKNIVTVHDLMYKLIPGFFGNNLVISLLKIKYFDFIVSTTIRNADSIISVSETTRQDVFKIFKVNSFHIPEDSDINENPNFRVNEKYNLSKKGYFFYCGNNRPHKNLKFVTNIFNLDPQLPPLVLAGKGHDSSLNVISVGVVSDSELMGLYQDCIAFIFPSKYEGFGLPILESLRSKTLVVASKIPAFLEFRSKNIFYFDLDSLDELTDALYTARKSSYIEEPLFLNDFSKDSIYKSLNKVVDNTFYIYE